MKYFQYFKFPDDDTKPKVFPRIFQQWYIYFSASIEAWRNCACQPYFRLSAQGIGYSFQLAITTPRINLIGYDTATAQSWRWVTIQFLYICVRCTFMVQKVWIIKSNFTFQMNILSSQWQILYSFIALNNTKGLITLLKVSKYTMSFHKNLKVCMPPRDQIVRRSIFLS